MNRLINLTSTPETVLNMDLKEIGSEAADRMKLIRSNIGLL